MRPDLESLFRAHYGRLVRALTVVSGSEEAAADAVQEAFVKAHQKWRTIGQYDDPVGWIRRVAINRLRDGHRSNTRKERALVKLAAGTDESYESTEVESASENERLGRALADLPKQQRLSLALFYLEGLSVAETAAALELSEGAVKYHLHQGRERLRGVLTAGDAQ